MVLQMKSSDSTGAEAIDTMVTDGVEPLADLDATDERGVSADLVRAYLNGIGRTRLLSAVEEVTLSKRIEAGLYADEKLSTGAVTDQTDRELLQIIVREGETQSHGAQDESAGLPPGRHRPQGQRDQGPGR